jgi:hypothetical protein
MKFKTIFIVFNIIIIFSFVFIFFMPLFLLGWEYSQVFWEKNWPLALAFAAIIAALNVFFGMNRKLFSYLEQEDWPELIGYLEDLVYNRGKIRPQYIKLLVNTYMVTSNVAGIERLEKYLGEKKPLILERNALLFGVPHVLRNDASDMESYFGRLLTSRHVEGLDWIKWNHAFSLLLARRLGDADTEFRALVRSSSDTTIKLLSIYFLATVTDPSRDSENALVGEAKQYLKKRFTREKLARELESAKSDVHVVILSRLVDDAADWLYT